MTPVDQTICDQGYGDCMRAVVATLLDLPIEGVPHFLASKHLWHSVYDAFLWGHGWENHGNVQLEHIQDEEGFGGYFHASVKSRNFENTSHAIVINKAGICVHDPSPNKNYQDEDVSDQLHFVELYRRRTDSGWASWEKHVAACEAHEQGLTD